jgi:hypothetical protein
MDKKFISNLDIARELVINRYMMSSILTNIYMLLDKIDERERRVVKLMGEKVTKIPASCEMINFKAFSIRASRYRCLCDKYGNDIIADACVILDTYMIKTGKQYKDVARKLEDWAIHLAMKDKLSNYTNELANKILDVNYSLIEDKDLAIKYIKATPDYMRNLDKGCKYLAEKFNIEL